MIHDIGCLAAERRLQIGDNKPEGKPSTGTSGAVNY